MSHPATLPTVFGVFCNYCYIGYKTGSFFCNVRYQTKTTKTLDGQNATCKGGPVLPIPIRPTYYGPYPFCANVSSPLYGRSNCFPNEITLNSFNASCLDPLGRPHLYQCEATSQHWKFYPQLADFSSYSMAMFYVALCFITCLLTLSLNTLNVWIIYKSRQWRASKTMIFGSHMTCLDLLVGFVCLPMYATMVYSQNRYFYKGDVVLTDEAFRALDEWFNRFDLLFLMASFTNLALMSLERFIVVYKPLWHMKRITIKMVALSIPVVWLYTLMISLLYYYAFHKIWFNFLTGFAIPTTIIIVFYVLIILTIKKSTNLNHDDSVAAQQRRKTEQKVTLNLLVLVVIFLFCWIPYFALLLYHRDRYDESDTVDTAAIPVFRWLKLLSYGHCFLDPILYSLSRPNVRVEVMKIAKGKNNLPKTSLGMTTRSTIHQTIKK